MRPCGSSRGIGCFVRARIPSIPARADGSGEPGRRPSRSPASVSRHLGEPMCSPPERVVPIEKWGRVLHGRPVLHRSHAPAVGTDAPRCCRRTRRRARPVRDQVGGGAPANILQPAEREARRAAAAPGHDHLGWFTGEPQRVGGCLLSPPPSVPGLCGTTRHGRRVPCWMPSANASEQRMPLGDAAEAYDTDPAADGDVVVRRRNIPILRGV